MKCFITCPVQAAINQMGFSVPGLSSDWKHQPSTSGAAPLNISILLQIYTENKQTNKPTRTFQLRPQLTSKLLQKANSNKSWPLNIQGTPTQPARPRTPVLGALLTAEGRFLAPSSALGGHSYTQLWPAGEHCIPMCITSLFPSLFGFLSPQLHFFFFSSKDLFSLQVLSSFSNMAMISSASGSSKSVGMHDDYRLLPLLATANLLTLANLCSRLPLLLAWPLNFK